VREFSQNPLLRLRLALLLGVFLVAAGTLGYIAIERMSLLDALFMTVITLSSVGYGEVQPLDVPGQIFTMVLIVGGIGTATWLFATVLETLVSEQTHQVLAQKRMDRVINSLHNHYIVCGYGRIGRQISDGYTQNKIPFLVIERDPERTRELRDMGIPCVEGDAADDAVLVSAGIHRAAALISVTPTDASNTFIVLSARGLRADLFIVSRADAPQNEVKLLRAGASKVISPYTLGARWMAATAINPAVTDFYCRNHPGRPGGVRGARSAGLGGVGLCRSNLRGCPVQAENRGAGGRHAPGNPDQRLFPQSAV